MSSTGLKYPLPSFPYLSAEGLWSLFQKDDSHYSNVKMTLRLGFGRERERDRKNWRSRHVVQRFCLVQWAFTTHDECIRRDARHRDRLEMRCENEHEEVTLICCGQCCESHAALDEGEELSSGAGPGALDWKVMSRIALLAQSFAKTSVGFRIKRTWFWM